MGLADPDEVYNLAVQALRRFRGAMGPTTVDMADEAVMTAVLGEVRAIRGRLERQADLV